MIVRCEGLQVTTAIRPGDRDAQVGSTFADSNTCPSPFGHLRERFADTRFIGGGAAHDLSALCQ
jgi:hypothetical protein